MASIGGLVVTVLEIPTTQLPNAGVTNIYFIMSYS